MAELFGIVISLSRSRVSEKTGTGLGSLGNQDSGPGELETKTSVQSKSFLSVRTSVALYYL